MTLSALALAILGVFPQGDFPAPVADVGTDEVLPPGGATETDADVANSRWRNAELVQGLMAALSREPRIIGTAGYARGLDLVEAALQGAGVETRRGLRKSGRAIPLRSDVLFYEDGSQTDAFAGLRERWDPDALPTMPRPMAYDHNPESADVRGAVIHLGRGLEDDFDRVLGLGLDLNGAILLATMELAPGARVTSVRDIAGRAARAGALGVLIAPTPPDGAPPEGDDTAHFFVQENTIHREPLPLPVAPIRRVEADAIVKRLRTKRVRGADGKATPLRLGPGPVEASIFVECPLVLFDQVEEIIVPLQPGKEGPTVERLVSLGDLCERPLGGTFELTAEVLALVQHLDRDALALRRSSAPDFESDGAYHVVFGPFAVSSRPALLAPASLPTSNTAWTPEPTFRTTLIPGRFEHFDVLSRALGEEWRTRMDAAAQFVGYETRLLDIQGPAPLEDAGWVEIARLVDEAADVLRRPL